MKRVKLVNIIFTFLFLAWILLGFLFIQDNFQKALIDKSDRAMEIATIAEVGLYGEMIKLLTVSPEDANTVPYNSIKRRLIEISNIDSEVAFSYLLTMREDQVYIMADSEPVESENYSPPGQHFFEADEQVLNVFYSGEKIITTPIRDRWGNWISVLVPMENEAGEIFAVFGLDYPAEKWKNEAFLTLYYSVPLVFLALIVLVVLFIFFRRSEKTRELSIKYKNINDNISDVVWRSDLNFNLNYVSSSVKRIIGCSSDIFLKSNLDKKVVSSSAKKMILKIKEELKREKDINIEKDRTIVLEVEHYRFNGEIFWAEISFKFIRDKDGKAIGIQGITKDISERKKSELELNKIKISVEQSPASIVITDLDGSIEYVNPKFTDVTGYSLEEAIGKNPRILKSGETPSSEYKKLWDTITSGRTWKGEFHNKRKSGELYWELASISPVKNSLGEITNFIAVKEDITTRKLVEKELNESNTQYESLTSNLIGVAYRCLLDKSWTMIYISDYIKKLSGYSAGDFIKNKVRTYESIIYEEDREYVDREIRKAIKSQKSWEIEYRVKRKNDEIRWVKEKGKAIKDNSGEFFLDGIIFDITIEKKKTDQIKRNESRYEDLIKQSRTFAWEIDLDSKYTYVSSNVEDILGYKQEEMLKKKVFDLHPAEGLEVFKKDVLKIIKNKERVKDFENPIVSKSGKIVWVLSSGLPVLDDKGEAVAYQGSDMDITYRKEEEKKDQENLEQKEFLSKATTKLSQYKNFKVVIEDVIKDLGTFTKSDRVYIFENSYDSRTASNTYEWCAKGVSPQKSKLQNLPYSKIKEIEEEFRKYGMLKSSDVNLLSGGLKKNLKSQEIKSVLILPLYSSGKKFGFMGLDQVKEKREWQISEVHLLEVISKSIASAYEKEKNLNEITSALIQTKVEKDKIDAIVQGIGDGVFVLDKNLEIILFNKKASQISGFKPKDVLGKKYSDVLQFISEKTGEINDSFVREAFSTGLVQKMTNHTVLVKKDETRVAVADSCAPLKDKSGEIIGCVVVFRDVSREREVDKVKSEFVSVVSHQLKTPLSGIKWISELMLGGELGELNKKQKEFLSNIYFNNERMIKLVNDLLDISHIETGRKFNIVRRKVDVVKIVGQVLEDNKKLAKEKNISIIKCAGAPNKLIMKLDDSKIEQVFANLINNAIKYSKKGGKIRISCEHKNGQVIFKIKDNGIGIPEEQQKKVFSKFFRAENAVANETDGTGLGLYIVKAIAEAHGGKIWFNSKKGQGTTFFFSLPEK